MRVCSYWSRSTSARKPPLYTKLMDQQRPAVSVAPWSQRIMTGLYWLEDMPRRLPTLKEPLVTGRREGRRSMAWRPSKVMTSKSPDTKSRQAVWAFSTVTRPVPLLRITAARVMTSTWGRMP